MSKKELLTHSRQDSFKSCRRKHYYSYELGLRRLDDAKSLRMGHAFHAGLELLGHKTPLADICKAIRGIYRHCPEGFGAYDWAIECETVVGLLYGYQWRWQTYNFEYVASEQAFRIPLINPETSAPSLLWDLAGKIDGIVKLPDGRLAVLECKTCSEDLGADSDYWRRLQMDHQISLYIYAARALGYNVSTVLYNVTRKPAIAPTPVPILDDEGLKIVMDATGQRIRNTTGKKDWRQTADKERNWTLQSRPMKPSEWCEKLLEDLYERPDFYFARVEIPRLDQDIEEYQAELWDIQQTIRQAQRLGQHFRTVSRNTCTYCSYFGICSTNAPIDPARPPAGFQFLSDVHPELKGVPNVSATSLSDDPGQTETPAATPAPAETLFPDEAGGGSFLNERR